jgi:hypothetical protein
MQTSTAAEGQGYTPLQADRYERKCLVEGLILPQVQSLVRQHPRMFYAPYPPRYVNSLYLDTVEMDNYHDNVIGAPDRRKVRLRWYGDLLGEITRPMLEVKIKQGLVGMKQAYPLDILHLDPQFCYETFQQTVARSDIPEIIRRDLRSLHPVLLNCYYRHYYASRDGCFRVTLDSELIFYKVNGAFGNAFLHRQRSNSQIIVEIKYARQFESTAERVISFFPFRVTRNSKYVQGVERVYF